MDTLRIGAIEETKKVVGIIVVGVEAEVEAEVTLMRDQFVTYPTAGRELQETSIRNRKITLRQA